MSDLIDRKQAIKLLNLNKPNVDEKTKYAMWQFDKDLNTIKTMPSAEKIGKWIAMSDTDGVYWTCSECGEEIPRISHYNPQFDLFPRLESINKTNYCPNCGAKME